MPLQLERKLKAQAKKKGFGKKRTGAYVYGTLKCECGARFKTYSSPEVHFVMPHCIAGKEEPKEICR